MNSAGTVTLWIQQVKAGDRQAADSAFRNIWQRYSARMASLARRKLHGLRAVADEDDVLQSVFRLAFERARDGKLELINDRDDLWDLLIGITAWKTRDQVKKQTCQKRGGGVHVHDSSSTPIDLAELAITELTPDASVAMAEEMTRLLDLLGEQDDSLRVVAEMTLEGATVGEIRDRLKCSTSTVERKLRRIRDIWQRELQP